MRIGSAAWTDAPNSADKTNKLGNNDVRNMDWLFPGPEARARMTGHGIVRRRPSLFQGRQYFIPAAPGRVHLTGA
ncbi:hypothetical protein GCM10023144_19570 [Pigmentiphaga soli]|uniref:Uncharacterized protein n=1 Tax=Pigmentiphaga soli TaxID=1007095 RepID=A0ABP8GX13_9BURK